PLIEATNVGVAMGLETHGAIRRFDKSPFQVLIDEARDATEPCVAATGKYPRHKPRVAGQIFGARETVHVADLQPDDRGKNLTNAGYAEQELDLGGGCDFRMDALFNGLDVGGEFIESTKLNFQHARGLGWKFRQARRQIFASLRSKEISDGIGMQAIAIHRRVNAVLEAGAQVAQGHASAQKLALIAQRPRWNPGFRQGSVAQKDRQAFGVERIGLVGLAHALLGLHRIRQVHTMAGTLHFIDEPIPVPGGLDGNLALFRKPAEKMGVIFPNMFDSNRPSCVSSLVHRHKHGESFVCIASDELLHLGHLLVCDEKAIASRSAEQRFHQITPSWVLHSAGSSRRVTAENKRDVKIRALGSAGSSYRRTC